MSMQRLIARIRDNFPGVRKFSIEVYIIDGNGDQFAVFKGFPDDLTPTHMFTALREPSCFYICNVVGIESTFAPYVDIFSTSIIRREFVWLTDPLPPVVIACQPTSIVVAWQQARFIGAIPCASLDSIIYKIEVAERQAWQPGSSTKYLTDLTSQDYVTVFTSNQDVLSVEVNDLNPATWYHFRLSIQYASLGQTITSDSVAIPTSCTAPAPPTKPRVYLTPTLTVDGKPDTPLILVKWSCPITHGSDVNLYVVKMQRYDANGKPLPGDIIKKNVQLLKEQQQQQQDEYDSDLSMGRHKHRHHHHTEQPAKPTHSTWKTVYHNTHSQVALPGPQYGVVEWVLQVKARNSLGWSEYSPILVLNARTHPSLFAAGFLPRPYSPELAMLELGLNYENDNAGDGTGAGTHVGLNELSSFHTAPDQLYAHHYIPDNSHAHEQHHGIVNNNNNNNHSSNHHDSNNHHAKSPLKSSISLPRVDNDNSNNNMLSHSHSHSNIATTSGGGDVMLPSVALKPLSHHGSSITKKSISVDILSAAPHSSTNTPPPTAGPAQYAAVVPGLDAPGSVDSLTSLSTILSANMRVDHVLPANQ